MPIRVFIDGVVSSEQDAKISVFDRGFLYGDSVYEVLRTSGGRLVDLERHLERLQRSGERLSLTCPPESELREAIQRCCEEAGNQENYVRIVVTRGQGEVGLDLGLATDPSVIVIAKPLVLPAQELYEHGAEVALVGIQRTSVRAVDPAVKSGNYLNNIMALAEARKSGAYEAIMCDREGFVAEGSSSNIFFYDGKTLCTPSLSVGLLAGITRQRVLELANSRGIPVSEGHHRPEALQGASEAFLTSSVRGILPISGVSGRKFSGAVPGAVTKALMADYQEFLTQVAAS